MGKTVRWRGAGPLGSLPLIVLSPGVAGRAEDPELEDYPLKLGLAGLSLRGGNQLSRAAGMKSHSKPPASSSMQYER
jgi:hypothetical protein